jgi:hypothetical protein
VPGLTVGATRGESTVIALRRRPSMGCGAGHGSRPRGASGSASSRRRAG